jgi:hypothetical protein
VQDAITLTQQLKYYKEYQSKLAAVAGRAKARAILADALYVVSTGTGDFLQNYYHNASLSRRYGVDQYCDLLVGIFSGFANVRHPDQRRPASRHPSLLRVENARDRICVAGAVQAGGAADRRHVHAAVGLPAGVHQAIRRGRGRVRARAQPRRRDLQREAERHRQGAQETAR